MTEELHARIRMARARLDDAIGICRRIVKAADPGTPADALAASEIADEILVEVEYAREKLQSLERMVAPTGASDTAPSSGASDLQHFSIIDEWPFPWPKDDNPAVATEWQIDGITFWVKPNHSGGFHAECRQCERILAYACPFAAAPVREHMIITHHFDTPSEFSAAEGWPFPWDKRDGSWTDGPRRSVVFRISIGPFGDCVGFGVRPIDPAGLEGEFFDVTCRDCKRIIVDRTTRPAMAVAAHLGGVHSTKLDAHPAAARFSRTDDWPFPWAKRLVGPEFNIRWYIDETNFRAVPFLPQQPGVWIVFCESCSPSEVWDSDPSGSASAGLSSSWSRHTIAEPAEIVRKHLEGAHPRIGDRVLPAPAQPTEKTWKPRT